jgi:2-keto-4-pentenoate hydratase/2-oxohepta-3-ene-1,7-dioic acid hydratase in catechol pathway
MGRERPGVLLESGILDLCDKDPRLPRTVREILSRDLLADVRRLAEDTDPDDESLVEVESTRFGPPITDPTKIICIGLNYADHAAEQDKPLPKEPLLFAKAPTTLCGVEDPILLPEIEPNVDIEAELAFVVGRRAHHVSAGEAYGFIAGYMNFNDVSGRQAQHGDKQWFRGKSFDTFGPCGPYLLTRDELPDPHALEIGSRINDFVLQKSRTDQLIHKVPQLLEYITRGITLVPGDIVSTGTPAGVGVFRKPPVFLKAGDVVQVHIERLGVLSNPVRHEHDAL